MKAKEKTTLHQNCIKRWFDRKYAGSTSFSVADLVFKWDKAHEDKWKHMKLQSLWIGRFTFHEKLGQHMYHLQSLDGKIDSLPLNGEDLKCYFQWDLGLRLTLCT